MNVLAIVKGVKLEIVKTALAQIVRVQIVTVRI